MEGLSGSYAASRCSDFISHPALGRHNLSNHQCAVYPDITAQDAGRQCPAPQTSSATPLSYGYPFGSPYYGCRLSYSQQNPEKYLEPSGVLPSEELSSRSKEFAIYSSFAGSYKTVSGYLDVPLVPGISAHPESRHETLFPMDSYQQWALSNSWDEQRYCSKEQTHFNHLWNSQCSGKIKYQQI